MLIRAQTSIYTFFLTKLLRFLPYATAEGLMSPRTAEYVGSPVGSLLGTVGKIVDGSAVDGLGVDGLGVDGLGVDG